MSATNINHAHEKVDRYLLQLQTAFFTPILHPALVAEFIDDRKSHHAAVYLQFPDFIQSQTRGATDPRLV